MRKIILSLLLAGAAASPALAMPPRDGGSDQPRWQRGGDRSEGQRDSAPARAERADRSSPRDAPRFEPREMSRPQPPEQPRFEAREQAAPRPMTSEPGWQRRGPDDNPMHAGRDPRGALGSPDPAENIEQVQQRFERRQQAIRETGMSPGYVPPRDGGTGVRSGRYAGRPPLAVSDRPQPGTQPPLRAEHQRNAPVQWSDNWRRDRRYDWQQERRHHRSLFHIGVYFDPFGWGYQPYQPGWRMWPSYYGSRYWINDPWQYRLPYAPPGCRWIRYWDDALLVDTWSGEVIDVIPNFFW